MIGALVRTKRKYTGLAAYGKLIPLEPQNAIVIKSVSVFTHGPGIYEIYLFDVGLLQLFHESNFTVLSLLE